MMDEERTEGQSPDPPAADERAAEGDQEQAPEPPRDEAPPADGPAAAEPAEAPETAEPEPAEAAEPSAEEERPPADEAPPAAKPRARAEERGRGAEGELPPGAELDPIALEPERQLDAEERARLEAEAEERARLEAEATAEGAEEPLAPHEPRVQLPAERRIQATGKRKTSVARVLVQSGTGQFEVNGRGLDEYFRRAHLRTVARQALAASGYEGTIDVRVRVHGGGVSGQAGAVGHGVARALTEVDPDLRGELKRRGLLSRDARIKERRKAGLKKARKRPQFSKR